jgi:PhoU domain
MPSSRSATHRAGHGSNRSAASTAKTGTSSVLEPRSWRAPVTSTISLGAGISAAAARNSSMDPNGSAVPCVNTVGTLMSGRCSVLLCPDRNAAVFSDPYQAAQIRHEDDAMDELHRHLFTVLMEWKHGVAAAVDITLLGRFYERFADHAVEVGRRVVFQVTGRPIDE